PTVRSGAWVASFRKPLHSRGLSTHIVSFCPPRAIIRQTLAASPTLTGALGHGAPARHAALLRDVAGNPFRPVPFDPVWRTETTVALARQMYESRDFSAMPILADALQDAGCGSPDILEHCLGFGPHVRGCWVVDWILATD